MFVFPSSDDFRACLGEEMIALDPATDQTIKNLAVEKLANQQMTLEEFRWGTYEIMNAVPLDRYGHQEFFQVRDALEAKLEACRSILPRSEL
jgi:hypothetical protein